MDPPFAAVFAFDAIHDQADPAGVLSGIHHILVPGGMFVMYDIKAASTLEDNLNHPLAPGSSIPPPATATAPPSFHGPPAAPGWYRSGGEQLESDARRRRIVRHPGRGHLPDDPFNILYVAHRPS